MPHIDALLLVPAALPVVREEGREQRRYRINPSRIGKFRRCRGAPRRRHFKDEITFSGLLLKR
ncbi:hypothetical protein J2W28_006580 [Variovorax boronicumulans]|uniref:hypothetical protein n=1 Tax=Variovorax boronicumulans TaxID=436515 RepID=UPI00278957AE|nr:hypothetical protein [Variovorax boronicumulans]MDP9996170.1 hypothetical protein [Variovorax boronicumulans]MDQ0007401.1 hypothetical protein [Variovorax boronicumulans]